MLAQIAEAKGDPDAARAWHRKARAAYAAFPGNWARLQRQWAPVVHAVAGVARAESQQVPDDLDAALERKVRPVGKMLSRATACYRRG